MKVSIVTISFNTRDLLKKSLASVFESPCQHELEVIVVDNNSHDGSCEMLQKEFPQVQLIANKENIGFAAACNQAQNIATGNYLILLNSDAWLEHRAIDNAVDFMEKHPESGITGGHLVRPDGGWAPSARRFPSVLNKLLVMSGLSDKFPHSQLFGRPDYTHQPHDRVFEVDWVPGAFTIFRSSLLKGLGMFDERFYMYFEEVDLCLRAKKAGWKVHFNPASRVVHIGGASSAKRSDEDFEDSGAQLMKFRVRSEVLYFRKNHGLPSVVSNLGSELGWNALVYTYNLRSNSERCRKKRRVARSTMSHILQALKDTKLGALCPQTPW